ncbi:MAG TPA: sigma-70 family RNA polymerase sigma factor [Candidatus Angelobacter sp.]|jgi:RNA polymerase sigma-70 factor (ECF subfamily)|nr:sigma-70 family RNA polymerase sigma factor [Candidatus Angelobacter sp.]
MPAAPHTFDSNYVNALRQGDPAVHAHFVDHFNPILLRTLRRKVHSADQARELRQETFLRVLRAVHSGRGVRKPESFEVFVIGVCNNVVRESYRAQRRTVALSAMEAEPANDLPSAYSLVLSKETRDKVRRILSEMDAVDRAVLKAVFLDNRNKDEVCRRMGVSRDYLRVLLYRAKNRFRMQVRRDLQQTSQG